MDPTLITIIGDTSRVDAHELEAFGAVRKLTLSELFSP